MRRIISLFIALTLILIVPSAQGEHTYLSLDNQSAAGSLRDACVWQDKLVILGSNGIYLYWPDTGEMEELLKFSIDLLRNPIETDYRLLNRVFVQDDQIFVFASNSMAFYRIADHMAYPCFESLPGTMSIEEDGDQLSMNYISDVSSSEIYLLVCSPIAEDNNQANYLFSLDIATETVLEFGVLPVDTLYSVFGKKLLAGKFDENRENQSLWLIDPETGNVESMNDDFYSREAAGFWMTDDGILYFAEGGRVKKEQNGTVTTVAFLPFQNVWPSSRAFMLENCYALLQDSVLAVRSTDSDQNEQTTIRILGDISDRIVQEYCFENPDVNIIFDSRAQQFQGLQSALLAGDSNVDLFVVSSDDLYYDVISKGFAASLSDSEILQSLTAGYYPWAKKILFQSEELCAIPVGIISDYWTGNQTKWQELGFEYYPQTYDELFENAERWKEEFADEYPEYCLFESIGGLSGVIQTVVHQYLLEHEDWQKAVDFDTSEFREIIQSILAHRGIFDGEESGMPLIMNYSQYLGKGYNDEDLVESILPPALSSDSAQVVNGSMDLLVLSPRSQHREQAIRFMEYYLSHLDPLIMYQIDSSKTEPLRQDGYSETINTLEEQKSYLKSWISSLSDDEKITELQSSLEDIQKRINIQNSLWRFSIDDIQIYRQIAEHIHIPMRTIYPTSGNASEVFTSVIDSFVSDSISLDLFIRSLNEKARMIFMENVN